MFICIFLGVDFQSTPKNIHANLFALQINTSTNQQINESTNQQSTPKFQKAVEFHFLANRMSGHHLRKDNTCLNCGYTVDKRYCSNCGQENSESRQSFGHLIQHFFEDITHYEGRFWQTMKYLFSKPGYLTRSFLEGKRNRYVPPVRLYIFISFVTFFLPYLLPDFTDKPPEILNVNDSLQQDHSRIRSSFLLTRNNGKMALLIPNEYKSISEMDSMQALLPESQRLNWFEKILYRKYIGMQKYSPEELADKYLASYGKNFPKALFIYMPIFALVIWLFHSKKRWYYYDHAILTLHYFSFMLLSYCIYQVIHMVVALFSSRDIEQNFSGVMALIVLPLLFLTYFFVAHKRFFLEKRGISFLKSTGIMLINSLLFLMVLIGLGFSTLLFLS